MEVITHKNSMNEFHCSVQLENEKGEIEIIPAVIDKIIFESDKILIFDYKTDTLILMVFTKTYQHIARPVLFF